MSRRASRCCVAFGEPPDFSVQHVAEAFCANSRYEPPPTGLSDPATCAVRRSAGGRGLGHARRLIISRAASYRAERQHGGRADRKDTTALPYTPRACGCRGPSEQRRGRSSRGMPLRRYSGAGWTSRTAPCSRRPRPSHPVALCVAAAAGPATRRGVCALQMWAYLAAYEMPNDDPEAPARARARASIRSRSIACIGLGKIPGARLQRLFSRPEGEINRFERVLVWCHWAWFAVPHWPSRTWRCGAPSCSEPQRRGCTRCSTSEPWSTGRSRRRRRGGRPRMATSRNWTGHRGGEYGHRTTERRHSRCAA